GGARRGRGGVEWGGGGERGRGRWVGGDDVGLAGNMLAQMSRQRAVVDVVAAAGATADQHIDRFALVELFHALRECRGGARQQDDACKRNPDRHVHASSARVGQWLPYFRSIAAKKPSRRNLSISAVSI